MKRSASEPGLRLFHSMRKEFKNVTITAHFGFLSEQKLLQENLKIIASSVFKIPSVHTKTKPAFLSFSGLKSVIEKLRFRDELGSISVDGRPNRTKKSLCFQITGVVSTRRGLRPVSNVVLKSRRTKFNLARL